METERVGPAAMRMAEAEIVMDREQAFLLYANFCGDLERTAHALNVRPVDVLKAAEELGWNEKLAAILKLKKSARPGDIERGINRAQNFVQAHKFRMFVDRVIRRLTAMNEAEFMEYVFEGKTKEGETISKLSTRALADLASAMEKCQAMSYQALCDTSQDRTKRDEQGGDGDSGGALHAQIAAAMAAVAKDSSPRAQLLDAQIQTGAAIAADMTKPTNPYDK